MIEAARPPAAEAPRAPSPAVSDVAATAIAIWALLALLHAVPALFAATPAWSRVAAELGLAAIYGILAAGLWKHRPRAWTWTLVVLSLRLAGYVAWAFYVRPVLGDAWHAGDWFGWSALRSHCLEIGALVLLLLPASRRVFAAAR